MSRVIKQNYVALSPEKKIIQSFAEFRVLEPTVLERRENAATRAVQDFAEDFLKQEMSQVVEEEVQSVLPEPETDLEQAQEEAAQILEEANAKKGKIYEEAYNSGMAEAKEELERRAAILEEEYSRKKDALERELTDSYEQKYQQEIHRLEGKMILWMKGMLEKLVGQASQREEVITHLIRMGMQEISLQGDLIIRVSEYDLDYVLENKNKLTEELSEKLTIEVLKDKSLEKNQCIIETIMGNIECSLDVQLKGLLDELRLIYESIMKNIQS